MKKFVAFVLVLVFALSLSNLALAAEKIRVGASPSPHAEILNAAKDALAGWDPTGGCLYYYNPAKATSEWIFSRETVVTIGKHVFAI